MNGHIKKILEDTVFLDACGEIDNEQMRAIFHALGYHIESDRFSEITVSCMTTGECFDISA